MQVGQLRAIKLAVIAVISTLFVFWSFSGQTSFASTQAKQKKNPMAPTEKNIAFGLDHFTAHCAECHGKDGKADTEKGHAVTAIDLTIKEVQSKTDSELFDSISKGVPGTAMPGFAKSHSPTEIWQTVLFLRKLPTLTPEERKKLEDAIPPEARHHHHDHDDHDSHDENMSGQMDMPKSQEKPMPKMDDHAGHNLQGMDHSDHTSMNSLMVMMGDEMGIRLGSSQKNVMSMGEMGSGTSRLPASTPMRMYDRETHGWLLMFHFDAKVGFNSQGGPRGVEKLESSNWFMPMAFHKLGPGTMELRGMFSFEPFTFPRGGTPLLFQTGETFKGQPLIDRQHPHDLFMELSATYTVPIGERASWFAYIGYPGEPALGPVAFMHRDLCDGKSGRPAGASFRRFNAYQLRRFYDRGYLS